MREKMRKCEAKCEKCEAKCEKCEEKCEKCEEKCENAKTHTPREPLIDASKTISQNSSKQYPIPPKIK
jgi:hypothetical protein